MDKKLTPKQRAFVEHYLESWNATKAARRAGYRGNSNTLAVVGWENLRKPKISAEIERRIAEKAMSADEVLLRLGQQARANIADVLSFSGAQIMLDPEKLAEFGHLIKSVSNTSHGLTVTLHDAQKALVHIGRHYALFTDKPKVDDTDWRATVVGLLKERQITRAEVLEDYPIDLAEQLFAEAGLPPPSAE